MQRSQLKVEKKDMQMNIAEGVQKKVTQLTLLIVMEAHKKWVTQEGKCSKREPLLSIWYRGGRR